MIILKALQFIKKEITWFLLLDMVIAIGVSLLWPDQVKALKSWVPLASFIMIYPMMINLNMGDLWGAVRRPKEVLIAVVYHFVISPLLLFFIVKLTLSGRPEMASGLVLISLMPSSAMAAGWTGFADGNVALVLIIVVVSFLAALAAVPIGASLVVGQFVPVPTDAILKTVLLLLLAPLILGFLTRLALLRWRGMKGYLAIKPSLSAISSLGLLMIVFIAFALKGQQIVAQPWLVVLAIVPMLIYYVISFLLVTGLAILLKESPEDGVALVYGSVGKNRSMATAIALVALSPTAVMAIAIVGVGAQIPMMLGYLKYGVPWLQHRLAPPKIQEVSVP